MRILCSDQQLFIYSELVCFLLKVPAKSQEISGLEHTVAALKEDYEKCLTASAASQKDLEDNLISSKHELLRVQEQLTLAEKVHPFSQPLAVAPSLSRRLGCA